jgi:DNA segregation ATPase FtsK/SpoIIIE, S-DNA-T family
LAKKEKEMWGKNKKYYTKLRVKRQHKNSLWIYKEEIIGVLSVGLVAFLSLALISYNAHDPSWFYSSTKAQAIANWCGLIGANSASLLVFLFGSASYLFIGTLLLFSVLLLRGVRLQESLFYLSGLGGLVVSGATLFRAHGLGSMVWFPGGLLGNAFYSIGSVLLGHIGILIAMYTLLWVSILVAARISIATAMVVGYRGLQHGLLYLGYFTMKALRLSLVVVKWMGLAIWAGIMTFFQRKKEEKPAVQTSDDSTWDDFASLSESVSKPREEQASIMDVVEEHTVNSEHVLHAHGYEKKSFGGKGIHCLRNTTFTNIDALREGLKEVVRSAAEASSYRLPHLEDFREESESKVDHDELKALCEERARTLEEKLVHFGVRGKVTAVKPGPVITLFEYAPEIDSKVSKIMALEDDLALALRALSIRIIAPIPGRSVVGFEIANESRQDVFLSDMFKDDSFQKTKKRLPLALGVDIIGNVVVEDLVSMPHLLVAGSTGSGKSVGLNTMLVSLLSRMSPDDLRLILIDPKRIEFASYGEIAHLLFPVVTNPRKAIPVLKWVVQEMEDRYEKMAQAKVRSIDEYRKKNLEPMPYIVLMIDELADLMMVAGKEVEGHIARIAQMARAAGIHMIIATQRPSVDVLTGLIKVNFPSRLAFRVSSKIDSRTIIDTSGAEKLLGRGDMLFLNSISSDIARIHCAYVYEREIKKLVDYIRTQRPTEYLDLNDALRKNGPDAEEMDDELYPEVCSMIKSLDDISISSLQRRYRIGFNRSARLIERLELDGFIAPAQGSKARKILH